MDCEEHGASSCPPLKSRRASISLDTGEVFTLLRASIHPSIKDSDGTLQYESKIFPNSANSLWCSRGQQAVGKCGFYAALTFALLF